MALRVGKHDGNQQRLLLARGTRSCRRRLGPMGDEKVAAMGSMEGAPGAAVEGSRIMQHLTIMVLDLDSRHLGQHGFDFAGNSQIRPGKGRAGNLLRGRSAQSLQGGEPPGSEGNRGFGHLLLDAGKPGRVPSRFGHQPVALAHQLLECQRPAAVFGIDDRSQAIEKAAAPGRRTGEQPVHRRGQPDNPHVHAERAGGALGDTVDAHFPCRGRILPLPPPRARRSAAERSGKTDFSVRSGQLRRDPGIARPIRGAKSPRRPRRAGRVRAPAMKLPRADWSCRRHWRR